MTEKKLYALTDEDVSVLKDALHGPLIGMTFTGGPRVPRLAHAANALTPLDMDDAIERMAKVLVDMDLGEPWPTNEELGGGPTGTRDDEYRHECMDRARAALDAALNPYETEGS